MARCEECLHLEVCEALEQGNGLMKVPPIHCGYYKPTADVVEVIRCNDCKHYKRHNPPIDDFDGLCLINEIECDTDFFCQYGKKKEGE